MHTVAAASAACILDEPACMDRHAWTGMHAAATAAAGAAAACMRAGAAACCVIDTMYHLIYNSTQLPELVLLTVPNIREYFYTKLRFSTPAKCALLPLAGQICLSLKIQP